MITMSAPSYGMGGHLGGDPSVQQLQQALVNLAIASGRPAINPGPVDGVMNDATVGAVAASLSIITEELPSWLYLALQAAFIAGSMTSKAKQIVTQYASQLTIAANTAAVKLRSSGGKGSMQTGWSSTGYETPAAQNFVTNILSPDWYKTPIGIGVIALGLFAIYKFFIAAPKTNT